MVPKGIFTPFWVLISTFLSIFLTFGQLFGQTSLSPGQVAIVGFNTSGSASTDNFGFILLTDVEQGTIIYFTDSGVKSNGCLRNTEGVIKWVAPLGGSTAGTMVQMHTDASIIEGPGTAQIVKNTFSLNVSGDQLIVFQHANEAGLSGTEPCPDQYVFALTNNDEWQADATSSHTSSLPPGLDATTSVAIPKTGGNFNNNATFDCEDFASGSAADILAALTNPDNWTGSESDIVPLPDCVFVVGDFWVKYVTWDKIQLSWHIIEADVEMIVVYNDNEITDEPPVSGENGSSFVVSGPFYSSGTIVYKGDNSIPGDTLVVLTDLLQGQEYFFKAFGHNVNNPEVWLRGKESIPRSVQAFVQDPTEPTATLSAGTNSTFNLSWTNYIAPKTDWWDGGTVIIARESSAVSMDRNRMNVLTKSSFDLTVGEVVDVVNGDFVAAKVTDGTTTASINLEFCKTYHFRIFHNHGNKWSDGIATASVLSLCPDIKVEGNSVEIAYGDVTPSATDHTQFGEVLTESSLTRTYKVKNFGEGTLSLTGGTPVTLSGSGSAAFSVSAQPLTTSLGPLAETTFQVTFSPTGACSGVTYDATVSIANDDPNESPFTYAIQGKCVSGCFTMVPLSGTPGTEVTLTGDGFSDSPLTTVDFDGVPATVTYISPTQVKVIIPAGVSGDVAVGSSSIITPNGCSLFNVIANPGTCPH